MLGAGERRFVLLDFLLIVLREARTGSSHMCAHKGGGGCHSALMGGNGEFTPIPRPASLPTTPDGGSFRRLQPLLCRGLPPVPGIASARTAAVFRPALAAHLPPPSLLPVAIQLRLGLAPGHPRRAPVPGPGTQRSLRRERGALAGAGARPVPQRRGNHAGARRAHRHAPFAS